MRRQLFTSTVALTIFLVVGRWAGVEAAASVSITCPANQVVRATLALLADRERGADGNAVLEVSAILQTLVS